MTDIEEPQHKIRTKDQPKFRRGCLRDCLNYLAQNPNKPVTAEQIEKATGWERSKIMHALAKSSWRAGENGKNVNPLTQHIEKLQTGMWRFVPQPKVQADNFGEPAQPALDRITVEVIKERPSYLLVEDLADGKIYKMLLVD